VDINTQFIAQFMRRIVIMDFKRRIDALPKGVRVTILRLLLKDMEFRIKVGFVGKMVPPTNRALADIKLAVKKPLLSFPGGYHTVVLGGRDVRRPFWVLTYVRDGAGERWGVSNSGVETPLRQYGSHDHVTWGERYILTKRYSTAN
jgi:hypothetical protein